ncbi:bifunctional diaminohydroxyphosphoribosylaminopyrimidine deaminase/5-amino-6-(5-phosphoribosylamino)uracil reductase RibD [Rothia sp. LK2588]|uniref:bifunctional diaminohydroxyphosphoribosylaminopyrimidine deaminase/5-amino-6-(5-phosphoribosylamino)uracil reductase RibD n=1 Tax=Rothia sp. LK2588 TaxID=3114369 RepID=UPI0034D00D48
MKTAEQILAQRGTAVTDEAAMDLALAAARLGIRGANPLVGAVITDLHNRVLHIGWHRGAGTAHAEADAIAQARHAGCDLTGARMFVTLEPCNHTGRTGPCSHAIAEAGITDVRYAYADQTDAAAGGAAYLRSRGIRAEQGLRETESFQLNNRWFAAAAAGRPWVTLKIASTMDGYIAASDGTSQWITGPQARADGHSIRARADAILVGTGTVYADNPSLTARTPEGHLQPRQPLPVIMGQRPVPEGSKLAADGRYLHLRTRDPQKALDELHRRGISHLMIEGGPSVATAFLHAGFVDEIFLYQAPMFLGSGRRAVGDLEIATLTQALHFSLDDLGLSPAVRRLGQDVALHLAAGYESADPSP